MTTRSDVRMRGDVLLNTDTIDDSRRRRDLARAHPPAFRIGGVRGHGRAEQEILRIHAQDAREL